MSGPGPGAAGGPEAADRPEGGQPAPDRAGSGAGPPGAPGSGAAADAGQAGGPTPAAAPSARAPDAGAPGGPPADDEYEGRARFEGGLLPRLLAYVLPHRGLLVLALLSFPLVAAVQLAQPWALKHAIDGPIRAGDLPGIAGIAGAFLGLAALQAALQLAQALVMQLLGQRVMRDLRTRLFDRVLGLAPAFFDRTPVGKVLTRLTGDVESLNELLTTNLVQVLADTVLLAGIVVVMLWLDWRLALVTFALVPLLVGAIGWLRGRLRELFRRLRNRSTALNTFLQESVQGVTVVQAFVQEARHQARHDALDRALYEEALKSVTWSSVLSAAVQLAQTVTVALLLWAALEGAFGITASLGLVVAFVDYVERFYAPIDNLSGRYTILQTALAAAEKIFRLMDDPTSLPEPAPGPDGPRPVPPLREGVALEGVTFAYGGAGPGGAGAAGEPVLRNVTLRVPRGQTVALVGATGAGKSTVVKLLGRFYDPTAGAVTWDGVDLRAFETRALRRRIAWVPQETFLFAGTLEDNVGLDPDAVPPARVRAAATAVTVDRVAADLPDGWAQVLGERGRDLSAGERQLVAFARALARDPDLLILDEATASIDGETEARVQEALATLLRGRTAVVIAHRLATIRAADRIVVLHKGEVREEGTHDELIARRGIYWTLYRLQSGEAGEPGP